MHLVVVDSTQIQPYIFGSNRLRENLGASYLVAQATEMWAWNHVPTPNNFDSQTTFNQQQIETDLRLAAEVVYAGGGNFVVLFREKGAAEAFTRGLSQQVLTDAPGLQLLMDRQEFHWREDGQQDRSIAQAIRAAFKALAEKKRMGTESAPLLGLGVTVPSQATSLPAVEWVTPVELDTRDPAIGGTSGGLGENQVTQEDGDTGYPASTEICAKLRAVKGANQSLANLFTDSVPDAYEFPYDLDHMGRSKDDFSHIAIVHADGNSMSERFRAIGDMYGEPEKNRDYIRAVRELSQQVKRNSQAALRRVIEKLVARIDADHRIVHQDTKTKKEITKIVLRQNEKNHKWWLPFRPIVFGGDDVTFVCDGRLGLALAAEYLQEFQIANSALGTTACAGVAVIKTHYPFARGYELANDLCGAAKKYRAENELLNACMDWHFALSGLAGDFVEIRKREYQTQWGSLISRPVQVANGGTRASRTWQEVRTWVDVFQGEEWMTRRNKSKALRDALRHGPHALERFRTMYLHGEALVQDAPYFDALELADWYVPLEK